MNAEYVKAQLMFYWVKRGYLCTCEVGVGLGVADVLADNLKETVEIEVKVNKYDLLKDQNKSKHKWYLTENKTNKPNRFYYCVPKSMKEIALDLIKSLDNRYGLITFNDGYYLKFQKIARRLKTTYYPAYRESIITSLCWYRTHNMIEIYKCRNNQKLKWN